MFNCKGREEAWVTKLLLATKTRGKLVSRSWFKLFGGPNKTHATRKSIYGMLADLLCFFFPSAGPNFFSGRLRRKWVQGRGGKRLLARLGCYCLHPPPRPKGVGVMQGCGEPAFRKAMPLTIHFHFPFRVQRLGVIFIKKTNKPNRIISVKRIFCACMFEFGFGSSLCGKWLGKN